MIFLIVRFLQDDANEIEGHLLHIWNSCNWITTQKIDAYSIFLVLPLTSFDNKIC